MTKSKKIDYTKMKKGKETYHGKITICPKCGNKAAFQRIDSGQYDNYTHKTEFNQYAGMEYFSTDSGDYCIVNRK